MAAAPPERQEALAALLVEEEASEARWDSLFTESHDLLGRLADEALEEHRNGRGL